ncbi:hypothetical protein [Mucilaginibacter lacusdianchii]|uniref:hypothetical protein n=1 Tax=Mucilaginibacter lacusdianchii TaxID=2684211 RepID=UPI00131D5774|nr:hypothetical protein [Mucilaginibacter sp. JXJ CY 39]
MASLKTKKAISNFLKKGFTLNNSHHHYYEFWHEGKLIAQTYTSHSGDTLDDYLIGSMKKQCKMEKNFFIEFAKCTKSKEDYIESLIQKGFIDTSSK